MRGHHASPLPAAAPTPSPSGDRRSPAARIVGVVAAVSITLFGATLAAAGASARVPESSPSTTADRVSSTETIPDETVADTSGADTGTSDESAPDDSSPLAADPIPPEDLGDDAELDALAEACFGGDLLSCDQLFLTSPVDSAYEEYGDTCGGRQDAGTENYCALGLDDTGTGTTPGGDGQPVPPGDLGDDPVLDQLAAGCYAGDMQACDDLYWDSPVDSAYEDYANTCGGRVPEGTFSCTDLEDPVPGTGDVPVDTGGVPVDTGNVPVDTGDVPVDTGVATGEIPAPTIEPTDLGTDPTLDALAVECYDGDMGACDELYNASESNTPYQDYGDTCAGRQPTGTGRYCETSFPGGGTTGTTPADTSVEPSTTVFVPVPPSTGTGPSLPPLPSLPVTTQPAVDIPTTTGSGAPTVPPLPTVGAPTVAPTVTTVPGTPTVATVPAVPTTATTATTVVPGVIPPATLEPTGLGTDPMLDGLAQSCYDGDMEACDQLWRDADPGSAYRDYGDTCAGRQESGTARWCVVAFPATPGTTVPAVPTTTPAVPTLAPGSTGTVPATTSSQIPPATLEPTGLGADPALDALAQECYAGDMASCDALFDSAPFNSPYQQYGDTCAGRQPVGTFTYCVAAFPAPK